LNSTSRKIYPFLFESRYYWIEAVIFAGGNVQKSLTLKWDLNWWCYSWEGKGRYGSLRLRMNVWVCR